MVFEWDEEKNQSNIKKHGVSFETAKLIFSGPIFTWVDDREDYGEERIISIGIAEEVAILTVAYTDREERIRLISARPASRKERKIYNEQI